MDFDDGTSGDWQPTGGPNLEYVPDDDGGLALAVVGRSADYVGIETPAGMLDGFAAGDVVTFSMQVRLAEGTGDGAARFVLKPAYTWIGNTTVTASAWTAVTGSYTVAEGDEGLVAYIGTADLDGPYTYYVDDIEVIAPEVEGGDASTEPSLQDTVTFPLGVAIDDRETTGTAAAVLTRHVTQITAENHMKPDAWYDADGAFAPSAQATELMDFAQANDIRVYGHVLVWHSQTPAWFFEHEDGTPLTSDPADQEILRERMRTHIFSVAEYLADGWGLFGSETNPLVAWDVVNEVVDDGTAYEDGMRRSAWYDVLGEEFVDLAFGYADEAFDQVYADPTADRPVTLFINDYGTESGGKQDRYYSLVSRLLERGVPLDGVGHQMHINLGAPVSNLGAVLDRFSALPVTQAVTELDAPTGSPVTQAGLVEQGYYYRDVFRTFRDHADDLFSVTVWGLNDGRSWRSSEGAPLLFNDRFQAKYAFLGAADRELPTTPQRADSFGGDVVLDADVTSDITWRQLPTIPVGDDARFQTRWSSDHLSVWVDVDDATPEPTDGVEITLDGDVLAVARGGSGDVPAVVTERDGGWTAVVQAPLQDHAQGDVLALDVQVVDGGASTGWSGEGTVGELALIEPLSFLEVTATEAAPVIDGVAEDAWAAAGTVETSLVVEGSAGATAQVRTLWSADELYVLMEVTDPVIDSSGSNPWTQDSVEIYVDGGNAKNGAYRDLDSQIRIGADGAVTFGTGDAAEQAARLTSAVAVTDTGYTVEAAVSLAGTGGADTFQGLDFQVNDASSGERTGVMNWANPTGLGYSSTAHWGVGRLVPAAEPVEPVVTATPDRVRIAGATTIELTGFEPGRTVVVRTIWGYGGWLPIATSRTRLVIDEHGSASTRIGGLSLLLPGSYGVTVTSDGDRLAVGGLTVALRI